MTRLPALTNAEITVLGLTAEGPRYGYQIEQIILERGMRRWTELGFSSIYHILNKLTAAGSLTCEKRPGKASPARRVFQITPAGLSLLQAETRLRLANPRMHSADLDIALAHLPLLSQEDACADLGAYQHTLTAQLEEVRLKWQADQAAGSLPWQVNELFSHACAMILAEQNWVQGAIERIHRGSEPAPFRTPAGQTKEEPMPEKIDLTKDLKTFYQPTAKEPAIVDVPPLNFLFLEGTGDPNTSPSYKASVESLYQFAYTLKFAIKKASGDDFQVMPLEGLWWSEDMQTFASDDKSRWSWRMMIAQPALVTPEWVETARKLVLAKKDPAPRAAEVQFGPYSEGLSVQLMHIGPYSAEAPNIQRIHQHALALGYQLSGLHHEIYLSDPNRTAPEKMRTILRQPIASAGQSGA